MCLADGDADELRPDVRKERVCESRPEAEEDREVLVVDLTLEIRAHGPVWMIPIPEADAVVARVDWIGELDGHLRKGRVDAVLETVNGRVYEGKAWAIDGIAMACEALAKARDAQAAAVKATLT